MNANRKINNLKRLVVLISIAILVVAVILVMSIYNNKARGKADDRMGGKSTVYTTTTDIIVDPDTGDQTIKISESKEVIVKGEDLKDNRTVKVDSNKNVVYKTTEDYNELDKTTIKGKDSDSNVIKEETITDKIQKSLDDSESVSISSDYIETLEPGTYTITFYYKDVNGKVTTVSFDFAVVEVKKEEPTTEPTTGEPTTEDTTTTTTTTKQTYTKTKTTWSSSSKVTQTEPPKSYNVITSGGSGYAGANSTLEWEVFNALNNMRGNKLKMTSELRAKAETQATKAINSFVASFAYGCSSQHSDKCDCDISGINYYATSYCANEYKAGTKAAKILADSDGTLLDEDMVYVGVGVVKDSNGNYSYVVIVDND